MTQVSLRWMVARSVAAKTGAAALIAFLSLVNEGGAQPAGAAGKISSVMAQVIAAQADVQNANAVTGHAPFVRGQEAAMALSQSSAAMAAAISVPDILAVKPCRAQTAGKLTQPLPRLAQRIADGEAVTVVAIGSSSTAGAGASSSAFAYPTRLSGELRKHFPATPFVVINRGVNGETVPDMVGRMESQVLAQNPDLVIWQLGTNTVVRDERGDVLAPAIRDGIRRIAANGADVILVDPQYAPRVLEKAGALPMVDMLSTIGSETHAAVFSRYSVMKNWHAAEHKSFADFITPDDLHLNDWGYSCFAHLLGDAIAETVRPARTLAHLPQGYAFPF